MSTAPAYALHLLGSLVTIKFFENDVRHNDHELKQFNETLGSVFFKFSMALTTLQEHHSIK